MFPDPRNGPNFIFMETRRIQFWFLEFRNFPVMLLGQFSSIVLEMDTIFESLL